MILRGSHMSVNKWKTNRQNTHKRDVYIRGEWYIQRNWKNQSADRSRGLEMKHRDWDSWKTSGDTPTLVCSSPCQTSLESWLRRAAEWRTPQSSSPWTRSPGSQSSSKGPISGAAIQEETILIIYGYTLYLLRLYLTWELASCLKGFAAKHNQSSN